MPNTQKHRGNNDRDREGRYASGSDSHRSSSRDSSRSSHSGSSNRGFAQDRELAREAGRKGGEASHGGRGRSRDDE